MVSPPMCIERQARFCEASLQTISPDKRPGLLQSTRPIARVCAEATPPRSSLETALWEIALLGPEFGGIKEKLNRSARNSYARVRTGSCAAGAPRRSPAVLRSSSMSGQWIP
jgi:hypothetical protein